MSVFAALHYCKSPGHSLVPLIDLIIICSFTGCVPCGYVRILGQSSRMGMCHCDTIGTGSLKLLRDVPYSYVDTLAATLLLSTKIMHHLRVCCIVAQPYRILHLSNLLIAFSYR